MPLAWENFKGALAANSEASGTRYSITQGMSYVLSILREETSTVTEHPSIMAAREQAETFESVILAGEFFQDVIDRIQYRPGEWSKKLKLDGDRWYFQWSWPGVCNFTGKPIVSNSAKYYLSPHMTQTEVVNRVFLAAVKAEEHETRERFLFRPTADDQWRAPYNTHIDIKQLYEVANEFDVRPQPQEDDS